MSFSQISFARAKTKTLPNYNHTIMSVAAPTTPNAATATAAAALTTSTLLACSLPFIVHDS